MSTVSKMAVKGVPLNPVAQAQTEAAEDKRPPGGTEAGTAAVPKKIFVCSPYRPTAENLRCQKSQLEANIDRAKTACRILSTLGFPAAGSASVFHSVLEGRGEEGAGDRHEAGIALAGGSR